MPGRISDDSVFVRWMRLELGKLNQGLVAERKNLSQLLLEEKPTSRTKAGEEYIFDKEIIETLGDKLPEEIHGKLRLPIFFFYTTQVEDSCYLNDENAVKALQILGELSEMRKFHEGKLWVGKAIVYSIMKKYPTAIQMAMG